MSGNSAPALVDSWLVLREAVKQSERAEHPDLVDGVGRVWRWKRGGLWVHDGMAWPRELLPEPCTVAASSSAVSA